MTKEKIGYSLLFMFAVISAITLLTLTPIEQDSKYHLFCNDTCLHGISNFWNVVSNLPFLIAGIYGFHKLAKQKDYSLNKIIFFTGVSLVSIGSGYYHLNPTNETLIWDRLLSYTVTHGIVAKK